MTIKNHFPQCTIIPQYSRFSPHSMPDKSCFVSASCFSPASGPNFRRPPACESYEILDPFCPFSSGLATAAEVQRGGPLLGISRSPPWGSCSVKRLLAIPFRSTSNRYDFAHLRFFFWFPFDCTLSCLAFASTHASHGIGRSMHPILQK